MDTQVEQRIADQNPYTPPAHDAVVASALGDASGLQLASTGKRIANLMLDYVGVMLLGSAVGVILGLIGEGDLLGRMNSTLFGLMLVFAYYTALETVFGFTLGKLVTGTRVVMEDGSSPGFGRILLRTVCRFIPFEALSFLGGGGTPVGLHDSLSKTRVVDVRARPGRGDGR